jgi:hypothetical protein
VTWDLVNDGAVLLGTLERLAASPQLLIDAVAIAAADERLRPRAESDGFFDRVVLWERPDKSLSIRLHSLVPAAYDRPHNHRASFAAFVLDGGYLHTTYEEPGPDGPRCPEPRALRHEGAGSAYVLDHSTFHATQATGTHLSLVVRGPSVKDHLVFLDPLVDGPVLMTGGDQETAEERSAKVMSDQRFLAFADQVGRAARR